MNPVAASTKPSTSPPIAPDSEQVQSRKAARVALRALDLLLENLAEVVVAMDDELYRTLEDRIFRSSPGGHIRHLLDHIQALFQGLASESGLVYYDRRARGTAVETDRDRCLAVIHELRERIRPWQADDAIQKDAAAEIGGTGPGDGQSEFDPGQTLRVEQIVDPACDAIFLESNALRELVFVYHHSIHHAALLAARLRQAGREVPEHFGIAPATLAANR